MHDDQVLQQLHKRLTRVEERLRLPNYAPTIPSYDSTNFPQDAVPGQIAKDQNETVWIYGNDNTWHQVGGTGIRTAYAKGYVDALGSDSPVSIAASTNKRVPFAHYETTDSNILRFGTVTNPNDCIDIAPNFDVGGLCICFGNTQFGTLGLGASIVYTATSDIDQLPHMSWGSESPLDVFDITSGRGSPTNQDHTMMWVSEGGAGRISLLAQNRHANDVINLAFLAVLFVEVKNPLDVSFNP